MPAKLTPFERALIGQLRYVGRMNPSWSLYIDANIKSAAAVHGKSLPTTTEDDLLTDTRPYRQSLLTHFEDARGNRRTPLLPVYVARNVATGALLQDHGAIVQGVYGWVLDELTRLVSDANRAAFDVVRKSDVNSDGTLTTPCSNCGRDAARAGGVADGKVMCPECVAALPSPHEEESTRAERDGDDDAFRYINRITAILKDYEEGSVTFRQVLGYIETTTIQFRT